MTRRTAALVVSLAAAQALGAPVVREGEGDRRDRLNKLEAAPLARGAFGGLTEWTGTDALDTRDLEGAVTLIVTLDANEPNSLRSAGRELPRLVRRYDDLTILAVHPEAGWDRMALLLKAGTIDVPAACDAGGKLAAVLEPDDAPDYYLFDRAGHLRYADFDEGSLDDAIKELLAESAEHAAGEGERRAAMIAAGDDPFAASASDEVDASELKAHMLSPSLYEEASWPRPNADPGAADFQGRKLPAMGHETWISEKDRDPEDYVRVLDFWATWCGPCRAAAPKLAGLQKTHRQDLMVLAIGGQREDERTVRDFVKKEGEHYYHLFDKDQTLVGQLRPQGIPHVVVVSTDGVVRWQGNPHDSSFVDAVKQTIKADPLIRARRGRMDVTDEVLASADELAEVDYGWPTPNGAQYIHAKDMQGHELKNPLGRLRFLDGDRPDADDKVLVLDFWATWCGPCKKASPGLDKLQQKLEDDVVIVGVSGQSEDQGTVERYIAQHKVSYRHAYSPDQRAYNTLGISGIPHVVVLSSDGVIRWQGNPLDSRLESVVERTIEADKKRREAVASVAP